MRTSTLLVSLLLSGCISTHATLIDPSAAPMPKVSPDSVLIFTDQSELDTLDYVRVAIIEATGSGEYTNQSQMLTAMRKKAGELGANGILLPRIDEPSAGAKVAAAFLKTDTERKGNVIAILVRGKKVVPSAPPSWFRDWFR